MDIKNFLSSSYNYESFKEFIFDKFYGFEENNTSYERPQNETDQKNIQKYKFIGSCQLDDKKDIGFFEIVTTESTDIENNRVSLNNMLKEIASDESLDSAISIFYNPKNPKVWRLSFIKFSYDENDKEVVSNLKRHTYVLGENIPIKTAYTQLKDIKYPTLDELNEAFSVEKISKEFFKKYKELYYHLVQNTQQNEDDNSFYIKKLLGRVVFLYFIQKKGWLDSNKRFISQLFETHTKSNNSINFYNDIMKSLFFEALNTKRADDKIILDSKEYIIPYLNGGLFEKDELDSKNIFVSNEDFRQILELFDSYNFTVIEDTPHDSEIAIDPEMLGKVFEDLLEDRKEKGAYYTPREIVHYMCQQSIINYLVNFFGDDSLEDIKDLVLKEITNTPFIKNNTKNIQEKLQNIKVLDPAIGSGAFPMGLLHEIVSVLSNLDKTANIGELKRKVIENSIYGIDIENSAVEIAKLRFWLSIVVDEDTPTPLPNLAYKIMVGNSLIETINGFDPFKIKQESLFDDDKHIVEETQELFHKFFNSSENIEKEEYRSKIEKNIDTVLEHKLAKHRDEIESQNRNRDLFKQNNKQIENITNSIELLKEVQKRPNTKLFFYKLYFAEVLNDGGFDIVIGNPPYIKEYTNKEAFKSLKSMECYQGKLDIWYLFGCKAIDLLKANGILSFIATNNWISNTGASKFRNKVLKKTRILEFIDFGDYKVFDSAGIQTMIFFAKKDNSIKNEYSCQYSKIEDKYIEKKDLVLFLDKKEDKRFSIFSSNINPKELLDQNIIFLESNISNILEKIERNKNFELDKNEEITNGVQVQQEFVNKKSLEILGDEYKLNEGIFILTTQEKDDLNLNTNELELIKPLYTPNEIKRYYTKPDNNYWVIYTDSSFKNQTKMLGYPNLKNHLDRFQKVITTDNKPYGIHRARNEYFFQCEKILSLRKCVGKPLFSYVDFDTYVNQAYYVIKSNRINLKYLTALLNSKLIAFWLKHKGKMQGDNYQVDKEPLLNIPIKNIEDTEPFKILVEYILFAKKENMKKEALLFESIVDNMVYDIYFEEDMKEANCFITNRAKEILKPFGKYDNDDFKKELIKLVYAVCKEDKEIQRGLIYSRNIEVIKVINGDK